MSFSETIDAHLGGATVRPSYLVELTFKTAPFRVWSGVTAQTLDGKQWLAGATPDGTSLISISNLQQARNGTAPPVSLSMFGIPASIMTPLRNEFDDEALNRDVNIYMQFWNLDSDTPLDSPYSIWSGVMKSIRTSAPNVETRSITLQCESLFSGRAKASFGMYTPSDQKSRFPGDKGCDFVPALREQEVIWPDS